MCGFAMKYLTDLDDSKNLVHEVFVSVWEKFEELPADTNYRSYLYTSTRNKCLNFIRDNKKHVRLDNAPDQEMALNENPLEVKELEKEIELAINTLPDKCRQVFEMSRYEELKYAEIAEKMNISVKTVEAHMSKALALLRKALVNFLSLLFFIFNL